MNEVNGIAISINYSNMIIWYNTLANWQQCCLWVLIILSVAGILRLIYMCYRICWYDKHLVELYIENARDYATKFRNNLNNAAEGEFLVRKVNEVSRILDEKIYNMPALEYADKIKYADIYHVAILDDLVRKIYANYLHWDEKRKTQRNLLLLQLFLPFAFWPFRGIEAFLLFLSEVLEIIGIKSFKTNGKSVLILSVAGGILGFLGNMASILSFLGIRFAE